MHQIETGRLSPTQRDCVFLWLWCRDGAPYRKYLPQGAAESMPLVFAVLRWDGTFGTIGGKVDAGETLPQALVREASEEANFWLTASAAPVPLGTFDDDGWHIHSFALEVSYAELVEVRANASAVPHASPECAGYCIVPTGHYRPHAAGPRGVDAFSRNQFCSTAKLEFELLRALIAERTSIEN